MKGPTGTKWIQAQLQRLNRWCTKWRIAIVVRRVEDGVYDVTLWSLKGRSLTIRVTTWGYLEYGVDILLRPDRNEWLYIQQWIRQYGLRRPKWTADVARQLGAHIEKELPGYEVYYADKPWGPSLTIRNGYETVATLDELGLRVEARCPITTQLALQRVIPREYQL